MISQGTILTERKKKQVGDPLQCRNDPDLTSRKATADEPVIRIRYSEKTADLYSIAQIKSRLGSIKGHKQEQKGPG